MTKREAARGGSHERDQSGESGKGVSGEREIVIFMGAGEQAVI